MKRSFKLAVILGALLATLALCLASCQTKNKIQKGNKEDSKEQSEVKKEEQTKTEDQSKTDTKTEEVVTEEETIKADSIKIDKEGNITYYNPTSTTKRNKNKNTSVKQVNDIKQSHTAKSDSTGKKKQRIKEKVKDKEIKESTSGKLWGFVFLIGIVLAAAIYIRNTLLKK